MVAMLQIQHQLPCKKLYTAHYKIVLINCINRINLLIAHYKIVCTARYMYIKLLHSHPQFLQSMHGTPRTMTPLLVIKPLAFYDLGVPSEARVIHKSPQNILYM